MLKPSESGQLLLPILAVLFLFGMFWVTYVLWCREVYWKMRMDIAADATALSAAREEAALLNYIATYQMAENSFLQEVEDYGIMQISVKSDFDLLNMILKTEEENFGTQIQAVAQVVANANGANIPAYPSLDKDFNPKDDFNSQLDAHRVKVFFFSGIWPAGAQTYETAYFTRHWSPDKTQAQPPHESRWTACRDTVCGKGRAHLWMNVDLSSALNNGGFPSENRSLMRSIGIQCFYPQFDAQLEAKK